MNSRRPAPALLTAVIALSGLLHGCATAPSPEAARIAALPPGDAILLGERHDAPAHHALERDIIRALAAQGKLAAVALEMAERGKSTADLKRTADEELVQATLDWREQAWPWRAYGPAVMAAVRAGVPVVGANLPRAAMQAAMADATLDGTLPGPALKAQQQAIRIGHCQLLPEAQIQPMTRVQVARDRAMAQTIVQSRVPGKAVVLLAGAGHVDETLGVPQHLPPGLESRSVALPDAEAPGKDHCQDLRRKLTATAGAPSLPASSSTLPANPTALPTTR